MVIYLLKSSICLMIFYLFYRLLLSRQTFLKLNRFYLIFSLVLSLLIPILEFDHGQLFEIDIEKINQPPIISRAVNSLGIISSDVIEKENSEIVSERVKISLTRILTILYWSLTLLLMIKFSLNLYRISIIRSKSEIIKNEFSVLILNDSVKTPFSFFRYVFLNPQDLNNSAKKEIFTHEVAHVRQLHTIDILLFEIATLFFWFNPFIHLYKNSVKEVHEYLADREVLKSQKEISSYKKILLAQTYRSPNILLASNNDFNLLKKRFIMMSSSNSKRSASLRYLLVLPLMMVMILAFSHQVISANDFSGGQDQYTQDNDQFVDLALSDQDQKVESKPPEYYSEDDVDKPMVMINVKEMQENGELKELFDKYMKHDTEGVDYAKVDIEFIIDESGNVTNVKIQDEDPDDIGAGKFVEEFFKKIKYTPGQRDGKSVPVKLVMTINLQ